MVETSAYHAPTPNGWLWISLSSCSRSVDPAALLRAPRPDTTMAARRPVSLGAFPNLGARRAGRAARLPARARAVEPRPRRSAGGRQGWRGEAGHQAASRAGSRPSPACSLQVQVHLPRSDRLVQGADAEGDERGRGESEQALTSIFKDIDGRAEQIMERPFRRTTSAFASLSITTRWPTRTSGRW